MMKGFFRKSKDSGGGESYHGANGTATAVNAGATGGYPYSSIESQTRLLADTLFLMRDYEAALSMYIVWSKTTTNRTALIFTTPP